MYCPVYQETIDEADCVNCEEDCSKREGVINSIESREKQLERLRSSELAMEIRNSLAKSLNLEEEKIDSLIIDLFDGAFKTAEGQLKTCLDELARSMAVKYIEGKAQKMLDGVFEKALEDKVLVLGKDEKAVTTKVHEIILNRTKKFFAEKDSYNKRNSIEESMDKAIARVVDSKVKDALKEITEEAIEKFNKEAMKKMMAGMVGAIQNDKRLLAVLAE